MVAKKPAGVQQTASKPMRVLPPPPEHKVLPYPVRRMLWLRFWMWACGEEPDGA